MIDSINDLKPGTILNNEELCNIFSCSTQGGMRRSHTTNTLVIVSNHIKSIYDDRWLKDIFHYTGMGTKGTQSLDFAQNKTLSESNENSVSVHLFEVFVEKEYSYMGQVELFSVPYFEKQPDEDGLIRDACVFPLRLKTGEAPVISKEYAQKAFDRKTKIARKLSNKEVERRAKNAKKKTGTRKTISQQHDRDPWVAEHAKRLANGTCQLCDNPAPFNNNASEPYLETHHIIWLAKGGEDTIENTVALCPNCHRKMHILNERRDVEKLSLKKQEHV
jgi:5-methylcytosine-specific restriction enzyme A